METLLSALAFLLLWRIALCTLGAIGLSLLISNTFASFTAGHCLAIVIAGLAFGIYWQARSEAGVEVTEAMEEPKISRPITFLGLTFVGLVCSAGLTALFGSNLLGGLALLVGGASVVFWVRLKQAQRFELSALPFPIFSLLSGYSVMLLLSLWASK